MSPNAILTLKEYLLDYADEETREIGEKTIIKSLNNISSEKVRNLTWEALKRTENGKRDLRFKIRK